MIFIVITLLFVDKDWRFRRNVYVVFVCLRVAIYRGLSLTFCFVVMWGGWAVKIGALKLGLFGFCLFLLVRFC